MVERDPEGFRQALSMVEESASSFHTPLTSAIGRYNLDTALKLLELGSDVRVMLDMARESLKGRARDFGFATFEERFKHSFEQPIIVAAEFEMHQVIKELLAKGADLSTPPSVNHYNNFGFHQTQRTSALDIMPTS